MEINTLKPLQGTDPVKLPEGEPVPAASSGQEAHFDPFKKDIIKQTQEEEKDPKKAAEKLGESIDKLNETARIFDRSLRFRIHDKTQTTMVDVIDLNTNKVIREIPSKEVLDFASRMKDYLGMIFDKKA